MGFDDQKSKDDWLKIITLKIEEFSVIQTSMLQKSSSSIIKQKSKIEGVKFIK